MMHGNSNIKYILLCILFFVYSKKAASSLHFMVSKVSDPLIAEDVQDVRG